MYQVCTECPGDTDLGEQHPEGTIRGLTFDPAGLSDRTAREVWAASTIAAECRRFMLFEGVCPACSGRVEKTLEICPGHDPQEDAECVECGRSDPVWASGTCTVCKRWSARSKWPKSCAGAHPAVIAFMWEHGIDAVLERLHVSEAETTVNDIAAELNVSEATISRCVELHREAAHKRRFPTPESYRTH